MIVYLILTQNGAYLYSQIEDINECRLNNQAIAI